MEASRSVMSRKKTLRISEGSKRKDGDCNWGRKGKGALTLSALVVSTDAIV